MKTNKKNYAWSVLFLPLVFLVVLSFLFVSIVGEKTVASATANSPETKVYNGTRTGSEGAVQLSDYTYNLSYENGVFGSTDFYPFYNGSGDSIYSYTGSVFSGGGNSASSTTTILWSGGAYSLDPNDGDSTLGTFPFYANSDMFIYEVTTDDDGVNHMQTGSFDFGSRSAKYNSKFLALADGMFTSTESKVNAHLGFTFRFSEDMCKLLQDRLLSVKVAPYIVTCAVKDSSELDAFQKIAQPEEYLVKDAENDSCTANLWYYLKTAGSGNVSTGVTQTNMEIPADETAIKVGNESNVLDKGSYTTESFFQVDLSNFRVGGTGISTVLAEVGIRVTITPNSSISISNDSEYKIGGTPRYVDQEGQTGIIYAKANDYAEYYLKESYATHYHEFYTCTLSPAGSTYEYDCAYYDADGNYVNVPDSVIENWNTQYTNYQVISSAVMLSSDGTYNQSTQYWRIETDRNNGILVQKGTDDYNYVSQGSMLYFNISVQQQGSKLYFENAPSGEVNSGAMFRKIFPSSSSSIIEFILVDGDMTVDQSGSTTGQKASIVVHAGGDNDLLWFRAVIRYKNEKDGQYKVFCSRDFKVYVDTENPADPTLNNNSFYQSYVSESGGLAYYTGSTDTMEEENGKTIAINIGTVGGEYNPEDQPFFTPESLGLDGVDGEYTDRQGSSGITVYYRSTYYGKALPNIESDRLSDGFTLAVNDPTLRKKDYIYTAPVSTDNLDTEMIDERTGTYIGRYCYTEKMGDGNAVQLTYCKLLLSFAYYDTVKNEIAYRKEGVWAVEFIVYDNVGNYAYTSQKMFVQVDINTYVFGIRYVVGNGANESLEGSDVEFSYEKLSASGSLSEGGRFSNEPEESLTNPDLVGEISLHRGDKIVVRISFASMYYNNYALSSLKIGGGNNKDCTGFTYTVTNSFYRTLLYFEEGYFSTSSGTVVTSYTFEVNDVLCKAGNESNRVLNFYFKRKAVVSASNITGQSYTGEDKEITTYATYDGERLSSTQVRINTVYYQALSETDGDYTYGESIYDASYKVANEAASSDSANWERNYIKYYIKQQNYENAGLLYNGSLDYYYLTSCYMPMTSQAKSSNEKGEWASVYNEYYVISSAGSRVSAPSTFSDELTYYYYNTDGSYCDVTYLAATDSDDGVWAQVYGAYSYIQSGGFQKATAKFDENAVYFKLKENAYCKVTSIVSAFNTADASLFAYRYENFYYYDGYEYVNPPKPQMDKFGTLQNGYNESETYYTYTGEFYVLTNYTSKLPTSALLHSYSFTPSTDTVFKQGVVYYKKVDENGSNIPRHRGTYYAFSSIATNINYFGQAVFVFRINAGTPSLTTLSTLKSDSLGRYIQISYGDSLAKIDSLNADGTAKFDDQKYQSFSNYFKVEINSKNYYCLSSNGVFGYFKVSVSHESEEYIRPVAGMHEVEIMFVPIMGSYDEKSNTPLPEYTYKDGYYYFVPNDDYNTVTATISVYVAPSEKASFVLEGTTDGSDRLVTYSYTGSQLKFKKTTETTGSDKQGYRVVSTFEDGDGALLSEGKEGMDLTAYTSVLYTSVSSMLDPIPVASAFTPNMPTDAGLYCVMVSLIPKTSAKDTSGCNYTGTKYWYMRINPIELTLSVDSREYEYQYEGEPVVTITKDSLAFTKNVVWTYTFYRKDKSIGDLAENCTDSYLIGSDQLRSGETQSTPKNAGEYVVCVRIDDNNYTGEAYADYTVKKVGDANTYTKKSWPSIYSSNQTQEYNISYGQPLREIRLSTGSAYYIRYPSVVYSQIGSLSTVKDVSGEFFVATQSYADWKESSGIVDSEENLRTLYIQEMKNFIPSEAKYLSGESYSYCLCFSATDTVNFDFLYYGLANKEKVSVRVGQAYLDWTNVTFNSIQYETVLSQKSIEEGKIAIANKIGYLYSENGVLPLAGQSYYIVTKNNVKYVYCYADTDLYDLEIANEGESLPEVGYHNIKVNFVPTEEKNFARTEYNCTLQVIQKPLTVTYLGELYKPTYNNHEESNLDSKIAFTGNVYEMTSRNGVYVYYDGEKYYEYSKTEKKYLLYEDTETKEFIADVTALPAQTYTVYYTLAENNYSGSVVFFMTIVKASLKMQLQPEITAEDRSQHLVYHAPVADLEQYMRNGIMVSSSKSGERVSGSFTILNHREELLGNYNTTLRLLLRFTPDDTTNYEVFDGTEANGGYYDALVQKKDISNEMTIAVADYVYGLGHGEYGALTKDMLQTNYSNEGKAESLNTYRKYVLAMLDYTATVPDYLTDQYEISVDGMTTGTYVNAGTYLVTMSIIGECQNYKGTTTTYLTVSRDKLFIKVMKKTDDGNYEAINNYAVKATYSGIPPVIYAYAFNSRQNRVTDVSILQTFYRNGKSLNTPTSIGGYEIRLAPATTSNYYLVTAYYQEGEDTWVLSDTEASFVSANLSIGVDLMEVEFDNLEQVYTKTMEPIVRLGSNNATCSLQYVALNEEGKEEGTRYNQVPVNAGSYSVHMIFVADKNNGYEDDVLWTAPLVIDKYTATVSCTARVTASYTGKNATLFNAFTEPYGLTLLYAYRTGSEEYTDCTLSSLGALDAGVYDVRLSVSDKNYKGSKVIQLTINPATLTIISAPTFASYVYHSDLAEGKHMANLGTGSVYCSGSDTENPDGIYYISEEDVKTLPCGLNSVLYTFMPTSGNFSSVSGRVNLRIVQAPYNMDNIYLQVDNALIDLDQSEYTVRYDGESHVFGNGNLYYSFDKDCIYDSANANKDFSVLISYSFYNTALAKWVSNATPNAIGEYKVTAKVSSKNYTGEKTWTKSFIITKGTPHIAEKPMIGGETFKIGDTLTNEKLIGGEAVNKVTGDPISGVFTLKQNNYTLTQANDQNITVVFTPNEENFNVTEFTVTVSVIGIDAFHMYKGGSYVTKPSGTTACGEDWTNPNISVPGKAVSLPIRSAFTRSGVIATDVSDPCGAYIAIVPKQGSSRSYGVRLSDFTVSFCPCHDSCATCDAYCNELSECGILSFVHPDLVPEVGDSAEVQYILRGDKDIENLSQINHMTGEISLNGILTKKEMRLSDFSDKELIGFKGKTLQQDCRLNFYVNGEYFDMEPTSITFDDTDVVGEEIRTVSLTAFVSKNYTLVGLSYVFALQPYQNVPSSDIYIEKTEKVYNAEDMTYEDLVPGVHNVNPGVKAGSYSLRIYDQEGNLSDGKEIGTYSVTLIVEDKENGYYGEKVFTVKVVKRAIEKADITVDKDTDTYGSDSYRINPVVYCLGERIDPSALSIAYRLRNTDDTYLIAPETAGVYDMKIVISTDKFYGEAVLTYTVSPRPLTMKTRWNSYYADSYTFEYGNEKNENGRSVGVEFYDQNGAYVNGITYTVYYIGTGYTATMVAPTNAGNYTAYVELNTQNYSLSANAFGYNINKQTLILETQPTLQTLSNGSEIYHIKYGTPLSALDSLFIGGKAVSAGTTIAGVFTVADEDRNTVYKVGTHTFTAVFTPTNPNYATIECDMEVIVAKVDATVLFKTLQANYTGKGVGLTESAYTVTPSVKIRISYVSLTDGSEYSSPVYADNYSMKVTTDDPNYNILVTATSSAYASSVTIAEGASPTNPIFVINKAIVSKIAEPLAVSVSVGQSLSKSSLNGGQALYKGEGIDYAVGGRFVYVSEAMAFGKAGTQTVDYKFIPDDERDYEVFYGNVQIEITKGIATIALAEGSGTVVYGSKANFSSQLKFVTKPEGLGYRYETGIYTDESRLESNVYYFTCWVDDPDYQSEVTEFSFTVLKKEISMNFIDEAKNEVSSFSVRYAKSIDLNVTLYDANDTTGKSTYLLEDADTVYNNIQLYFVARETESFTYSNSIRPTEIGSYTVTATLIHDNYTASCSATYRITKGVVEQIIFDENSLVCEYGKVSAPIITTIPYHVQYEIVYAGYENKMPTDINSYTMTVYITDENYTATQVTNTFRIVPKTIEVTNIKVEDKMYNGTPTVEISGKLSGVLYNDEVTLTLTAETADGDSSVGVHPVVITSYALTGLKAKNYQLKEPVCNTTITIKSNVVKDENTNSYMSTKSGFVDGTSISFYEVATENNKSNVFTEAIGVKATVVGYNITVNGESTIVSDQYKIYMEIPEEYRDKELTVEATGTLSDETITFTREGNYITFYASSSSGEIVFSYAKMDYTYIVLIVAGAFFVIGLILILILNPLISGGALGSNSARSAAISRIRRG